MKKLVLMCAAAMVLTACDGDVVKSAARVVLADEIQQMQQNQQQTQPVQQGQLQPVQPVQPIQNMSAPVEQMVQDVPQQPQAQKPVQAQQPQLQQPIQQPMYIDDGAMQQPVQKPAVVRQSIQPKPAPAPRRATGGEQIVRKRAYVLTQYGDNVRVRSAPSRNGRYVGYLYDGEEIWIVGETNKCQSIDGVYGCWVKVLDSNGLTGYSFGGYLQY